MLSDKMEFSITLWNIWSMLPFPGKSTAMLCGVGKHFTLRLPQVAGRNRRQKLQTRRQSSRSRRHLPPLSHGGDARGGSPARHHGAVSLLETQRDARICPYLPTDFSSHPKTSLRSDRHLKPSLSQTNPRGSSAEDAVRKGARINF